MSNECRYKNKGSWQDVIRKMGRERHTSRQTVDKDNWVSNGSHRENRGGPIEKSKHATQGNIDLMFVYIKSIMKTKISKNNIDENVINDTK